MSGMKDRLGDTPFVFPERSDRTFDGATFEPKRDLERLRGQLLRVFELMKDGRFRTLDTIASVAGGSVASVSARLRDLRKDKFGGHVVNRERRDNGLFEYQLVVVSA